MSTSSDFGERISLTECGDRPEAWTPLCRLRYILDHWQDIFDPGITSTWATFTGTSHQAPASKRPSPLPEMASDLCVRRIERALTVLADREPVLARHLKAYRCNAEWRCKDELRLVTRPSGKHELIEPRVRDRIVPRWVELAKVDAAERRLLWLLGPDVSIPQDLWVALTKP